MRLTKFGFRPQGRRIVALGEQVTLSLASFVLLWSAGRLLKPDEVASIAIGLSVAVAYQAVHRVAIITPFVIETGAPGKLMDEGRAWAKLALLASLTVCSLGFGVAAAAFAAKQESWLIAGLAYAGPISVAMSMSDFVRRLAFQMNKLSSVTLLTLVCSSLQIASLYAANWSGHLSGPAAFVIIVASVGAPSFVALYWWLASFPKSEIAAKHLFVRLARLGAWSSLGTILFMGFNQFLPMILGIFAGPHAVSGFSLTRSLAQPSSILAMAANSVDKPLAGKRFHEGGVSLLQRHTIRSSLLLMAVSGMFLIALSISGPYILHFLYDGEYDYSSSFIYLWAAVYFLNAGTQALDTAMFVRKQGRSIFAARAAAAAVGLAAAFWLIPTWGGHGAIGSAIAAWVMFAAISSVAVWSSRDNNGFS